MGPTTPAFIPRHEITKLLQGLIALNIDSVKGLREAAAHVRSATPSHVFLDAADTRESFTHELQETVANMGATPAESGTAAGDVHRWWMGIRGRIGEGDHPVLAEAERGEFAIRRRYEEVLEQPVGGQVHAMLARQYDSIRRSCDTISALRKSSALA